MTIQKAIANIDEVLNSTLNYDDTLDYQLTTDDCDWLIIAKSALEKQIPEKPIVNSDICHYVDYQEFSCPYCGKRIISRLGGDFIAGRKQQHCDKCGKAIDWSETEK